MVTQPSGCWQPAWAGLGSGVGVVVEVKVAWSGGKCRRLSGRIWLESRQLPLIRLSTVVEYWTARLSRVSPNWTVYRVQLGGKWQVEVAVRVKNG